MPRTAIPMNDKQSMLVTGATGFIGRAFCQLLIQKSYSVRGTMLSHEASTSLVDGVEPVLVEPLGPETSWKQALVGIDTVVHLAARVHMMDDPAADPLVEFRKANVAGTLKLACDAATQGVRRFVFISSVKVNGEESAIPYNSDSRPEPCDPYGISKWEAEQELRRIEAEMGIEVVIVRPTLVYGPAVKANFLNILKIISKGVPLPLASVNNRRSLVYLGNLVDALAVCAVHPGAAGKTYLVSDGEDVSTPELILRIANSMNTTARLFPFPAVLLLAAARMVGKRSVVQRLTGSLQVDSSKIRKDLNWVPPYTMMQGLQETGQWFLTGR
ncbi:SDR family oxidoreductase [Geobacter sp. DSM 9736]|uniref:UDP-glucose 4-epimerase family protein n=1 Tax=Geobacter sp. DSM 9736 TaxID=1277350 RepID=UPI000B5FCE8F|nr:SDR family oxidoreductase [Geobacter sp. DSM 9736]SNB45066.1 Nucleoside-diphosphate-sugar epimerase [Geobacter sp. DSM 9736]